MVVRFLNDVNFTDQDKNRIEIKKGTMCNAMLIFGIEEREYQIEVSKKDRVYLPESMLGYAFEKVYENGQIFGHLVENKSQRKKTTKKMNKTKENRSL